jgi:hypothetical protein
MPRRRPICKRSPEAGRSRTICGVSSSTLIFKAHDRIHGYSPRTVTVDLLKDKGPSYSVEILPGPSYSGQYGSAKRYFRGPSSGDIPDTW